MVTTVSCYPGVMAVTRGPAVDTGAGRVAGPVPSRERAAARLGLAVLLVGVLLGGVLTVPAVAASRLLPSVAPLPAGLLSGDLRVPATSMLTDAEGAPFARFFDQDRDPVEIDEVAPAVRAAVVAVEDRRFGEHGGVDWTGVARALAANAVADGNPLDGQGASTVTMQYVKNHRLYAQADTAAERDAAVDDTVARKLADARAAVALERRLSKPEIMQRYLNTVYFGNGAYGIAAAARTYFGVGPAELDLAQAALLVGMVRSPGLYDPVERPDAATGRRAVVLRAMLEVGSIDEQQAAAARSAPLGVVEPLRTRDSGCTGADPGTGFFCRHVVDSLAAQGVDEAALRSGGYTVATTLSREATAGAAAAAAAQAPATASPGIANAVAVVEPGTGSRRVLALASNHELGTDIAAGQSAFPLPTAPVPYGAGSTYKIFTAAAALQAGLGLRTDLSAPEEYTAERFTDAGEPYAVTGDGGAGARTDLTEALALSPNTTFVALVDRLGSIDPVVEMARLLGMRESLRLPAGDGRTVGEQVRAQQRASFTLGPVPAIPLELANVGATIVSDGVWCPPTVLRSVTDRAGGAVAVETPACAQAVPAELADTLAAALSEDTTYGTAQGAADAEGWSRPMIGKTGTTQDNLSASFVGATPQLAAAVMTWSDASPPRPVCAGDPPRLCAEGTLFGGTVPARTWFATMGPLHDGREVVALPEPAEGYLQGGIGSGTSD